MFTDEDFDFDLAAPLPADPTAAQEHWDALTQWTHALHAHLMWPDEAREMAFLVLTSLENIVVMVAELPDRMKAVYARNLRELYQGSLRDFHDTIVASLQESK